MQWGVCMSKRETFLIATFFVLPLLTSGCATYKSISTSGPGRPKVYSGALLDLAAITRNDFVLRKYKVDPPTYPLLDLPCSVVLDTLILPLTSSVAMDELVFK